jgi:hypothetical protein
MTDPFSLRLLSDLPASAYQEMKKRGKKEGYLRKGDGILEGIRGGVKCQHKNNGT